MNYPKKGFIITIIMIEYLCPAMNHSKCLTCVISFNSHRSHEFLRYELLCHQLNFITWWNLKFREVTKLAGGHTVGKQQRREWTGNSCVLAILYIVLSLGVVATMETVYGVWVMLYLVWTREHMYKPKFKEMDSLGESFRKKDVSFCINISHQGSVSWLVQKKLSGLQILAHSHICKSS